MVMIKLLNGYSVIKNRMRCILNTNFLYFMNIRYEIKPFRD